MKAVVLFLCALCLACSSNQRKAKQRENNEAYLVAKSLEMTDSQKSCAIYTKLSQENDYALRKVSLIKARTFCLETSQLEAVPEDLLEKQPWLAQLILEQRIIEAQRTNQQKNLAEAYYQKALLSDTTKNKLDLLLQAKEAAKKSEDLALLKSIEDKILQVAPRFIKKPRPEEYFKVAADLIFQREFQKGRQLLKKITSPAEEYLAKKLYRNSFKVEQNKKRYAQECEKFALWAKDHATPGQIHEAYMTWARTLWTQGKREKGQNILAQLEKLPNYQGPKDELEYIRGRMSDEEKKYDQSLVHYDLAEKNLRDKSIYKDRILFAKAWTLRRLQRWSDAVASFDKIMTSTEDPSEKSKAQFWKALSLKKLNEEMKATEELKLLSQNDPLGYYGLLAFHETKQKMPPLPLEQSPIDRAQGISEDEFELSQDLASTQENELLEKYLNLQSQKSSQGNLYYLKFYAQAGLYLPLFAQITKLDTETKKNVLSQHPEFLFPRRYLDVIDPWSKKFNVSPNFALSIIRQESAFNPKARSAADALGLMQLLPQVAQAQSPKTGIKVAHFEDLYLPENNIPAGISLLSQLKQKYKGQLILMAAAYNASDEAINGWLKTKDADNLEFIENIPYEETKVYIKTVMRNYIFYSRLENPTESLLFPSEILDLKN